MQTITSLFQKTKLSAIVASLAIILALALPMSVNAAPNRLDPTGFVTTGRLNLRSGPLFTYSVVVMVDKGIGFTLIGRNTTATWVQVRLPSGIVGWFNVFYIHTDYPVGSLPVTGDAVVNPPSGAVKTALVVTGRLNVRSAPDPFAQVLTIVDKHSVLVLVGRNTSGTWAQVIAPNGTKGWVNGGFIRSNGQVPTLPITGP